MGKRKPHLVRVHMVDDSGNVADVAFTGRGCAISQASASLLTDTLRGRSTDDLLHLGKDDVLDLLGIEISPARLKCALLSLDTLQRALSDRPEAAQEASV